MHGFQAVDLEGNPNFNCSTLDYYNKVVVMSDCGKSPEELLNNTLPATIEPTAVSASNDFHIISDLRELQDCDFACQRDRHVKALQDYLIRLWRMIKTKMAEMKRDNKWMQDVEDFFNEWSQKISDTIKELGSEGKKDESGKVLRAEVESITSTDNSTQASSDSVEVVTLEAAQENENSGEQEQQQHVHIGNAVGRRKFFRRR